MKNLKLHKSQLVCIEQLTNANSAIIINNGEFCYSTDHEIWRVKLGIGPLKVVSLVEIEDYKDQEIKIISYAYNQPWDSFLVGCSNGDIILIQENIVEIAFKCDLPPSQIICSPDYERSILVSEGGQINLVSECFEVLNDFNVKDIVLTEQHLVNVGWGKKETQFHGSEGKSKRNIKEIIGDDDNTDKSLNVCWRCDSLFFAVGYFNELINLRTIKIFNRDGILQFISESLSGIETVLSWKTSKDLMSFPQKYNGEYFISFMEKNGLKHGDFKLPSGLKVNQILWSIDCTILCLHCYYSDGKNCLILLRCTNYQWQIKKWMIFESSIIAVKWLLNNNLELVTKNGLYFILHWIEILHTSNCDSLDWVAVINNCSVLLTPFNEVVIPPPMYHTKLILDKPIESVLFLPRNLRGNNCISIVCNDNSIHIYDYSNDKQEFVKNKSFKNTVDANCLCNHWFWFNESTFIFSLSEVNNIHHVCVASTSNDNLKIIMEHNVSNPVIGISYHTLGALIQLSDGNVLLWKEKINLVDPFISFPEECMHFNVMEDNIYGLGISKRLFENERIILNNVDSFCLKYPFVLAVTLNQSLIAYNIHSTKDNNDKYQRRVEMGSTIITTTGNSVILQLPRGNLETIRPRPLTVLSVVHLITEQKYLKAFELLRKERINLNVLCDLNSLKFIKDLKIFLSQIQDPSWISLFIMELENKNYLNTVYVSQFQQNNVKELDDKVQMICSQLILTMNQIDRDKYAFPLLGCYVKLKQYNFALKLASLKNEYLKHLLFLVDVDQLYKASLSEYNLEIAMKIINNSQLDPKEYVPFLKKLEKMDYHYMCFTIDDKLGNKNKALVNLVNCKDKFEEILKYTIDNNLYCHALTLYSLHQYEYKLIATHYGDDLFSKMDYKQAAIIYCRSSEKVKAIECFIKAGYWKEALQLCYEFNCNDSEKSLFKNNIVLMLSSTQRYKEAAEFAELELHDYHLAVEYSIRAQNYIHALYLASSIFNSDSKLVNQIKSACVTSAQNLILDIISSNEKFDLLLKRLIEVRKQIAADIPYNTFNDTSSEISSMSSYRTTSTRTSCRSARKQQRKMWNLKEGNFREQPTLVLTLKQIVEKSENYKSDVKNMSFLLLRLDEHDVGQKLQKTLNSFITCIYNNKSIIWPVLAESEQVVEDTILLCPLKIILDQGWKLSILDQIHIIDK
ncbi:elongator complex protein 1 [Daktulosphaira vitifoliae]|uniref:elongator complex protein 1 n=1 Tax=Daktulosphaira vitifoliae TaxID=58002 RepID=UPI0021AAA3BF|nr:elongator complex protein 1 [Daktulosphaira vitifoliae]